MNTSPASHPAGHFSIGGDMTVSRLGFGAMRITGKGVWGPPADLEAAETTLHALPGLGVNFIDTADSYGPFVSEELIARVLFPYKGMVIATKGGLARSGPDVWEPLGRPEYLRQCVHMSLRRLKLEQLPLWQLHRVDPKVPRDEQFDAIADLQKAGLINHVGLSEVQVDDIEAAGRFFRVATVQNLYNLSNRQSESVLDYCETHGIGFIPWFPLASGSLARPGGVLDQISRDLRAEPGQVALAWLLRRSPVMLPIPGTSNVEHLKDNMRAGQLELSDAQFAQLEEAGKRTGEQKAA
jgi:pyridoxine 4-dehydrogenase